MKIYTINLNCICAKVSGFLFGNKVKRVLLTSWIDCFPIDYSHAYCEMSIATYLIVQLLCVELFYFLQMYCNKSTEDGSLILG